MSTQRYIFLFLILGLFVSNTSEFPFLTIIIAAEIVSAVTEIVKSAVKIAHGRTDFPGSPQPLIYNSTDAIIFEKINNLSLKLDDVAVKIDEVGTYTMSTIIRTIPERKRLELRLNDLLDYMIQVDVNFERFSKYTDRKNNFERSTLEDFATKAVSNDTNSIISLMEKTDAFILPPDRGMTDNGILQLLLQDLGEIGGDTICNVKQSHQQVIYNLYNYIVLTELKSYSMIQFSYMLLGLYHKGSFATEAEVIRERFIERTNNVINVLKKVMGGASREFWKCDPKKYVQGETYEEVIQLLQGYVQNEIDMNSDGSCRKDCNAYSYTKSYSCFANKYCGKQRRCNGKIVDCKSYDNDMWICPAAPSSDRRYEYVNYDNGTFLGRDERCSNSLTKVESWWRFPWHCSYCFCICDDQGSSSHRYVNMRPVISDISNNMVVVGLRFVKHNRIIHVQIQEGKLLPRGNIDTSTVRWVPVENYNFTNSKSGQDYHTFSYEERAIDLDDLEADQEYVLTGIRFKAIGSHLKFEIYTTKFDFETGMLIDSTNTSIWKHSDDTKNPRMKISLYEPDIPTRTRYPSIPKSKSNSFIEFTHTDIYKDAAQTTVPFLDSQKVESFQPVPLSGAGIFHKGRDYYGGFITLKIFTYDFSKHLQAAFPEEETSKRRIIF